MSKPEGHPYPPLEPDAPGVDPVAACAVEAFFTLFACMHGYYARVCESFDLTPLLGTVLRGLAEPTPMRGLARSLHMDASNLTGLVDRLEDRGLVQRRPDPGDRRIRQLVLTDEGVRLRQMLNARLMSDPPLLAGLDDEQRRQLRALLTRSAAAAGADPETVR